MLALYVARGVPERFRIYDFGFGIVIQQSRDARSAGCLWQTIAQASTIIEVDYELV